MKSRRARPTLIPMRTSSGLLGCSCVRKLFITERLSIGVSATVALSIARSSDLMAIFLDASLLHLSRLTNHVGRAATSEFVSVVQPGRLVEHFQILSVRSALLPSMEGEPTLLWSCLLARGKQDFCRSVPPVEYGSNDGVGRKHVRGYKPSRKAGPHGWAKLLELPSRCGGKWLGARP
jgi:hypothetical protein